MKRNHHEISSIVSQSSLGGVLTAALAPVSFADSKSSDEWQFNADVYLWGASIDARPTGGDNLHISFRDLIDNLDMAFMGGIGARKGKWSLLSDLIYLDVDNEEYGKLAPLSDATKRRVRDTQLTRPDLNTKVDYGLKAWIITLAGGYRVMETEKADLDLIAGARYLWIKVPLKFEIGSIENNSEPADELWDGIVGARGKVALSDKWYMNYYGDVGGGGSDLTWQARLGLGYRFDKVDAIFGYRYLDYNLDGDLDDLTVKGPYAGV